MPALKTATRERTRAASLSAGHFSGEDLPCRIEDYGLIGDCETAALVGRDGSIDWLCWPAFDSDACFAALLGTHKHGRWLIAPAEEVTKSSRRYWDNTLILETRFETADGVVALIDFMPPRGKASDVVRLVRGVTRQGEDADAARDPLRLRRRHPLGQANRRRPRCWRSAGRT